ncbi:MAG TPA: hypothetical protein VNB90_10200 [Cytophagaceae bacterium]|jgi:hypothetical protein|nr:hypothetical protein [Cytophagaceae bacterium]
MQKCLVIFSLLCCVFTAQAQKIKIQESSETVEGINRQGMYVLLELDKKEVEKSWLRYLKQYGKTETSKGLIFVQSAEMKAISDYPCRVLSMVEVAHTGARVWWAIDMGSKFVTKESEAQYAGAEKMLYEFAVNAYKEDVNRQIIDAEGALEAATKIHEKEVTEGINLQDKTEANQTQKAELENKLKINQEDYTRLNREIDNNFAEQKTALLNVENIKASQHAANGQPQTDEEKKALTEAIKSQQKKVSEGERLAKEIARNKQTRTDLEAKQKKNAAELVELTKQQEQNKIDQQAASVDVDKMKKALEIVKDKMNHIE